MNNRGPDRGMLQPTVPLAGRPQGPPPRRRPPSGQPARPAREPNAAPRPYRPDAPVHRQPPRPAPAAVGSATVPVARVPAPAPVAPARVQPASVPPVQRQRPAGGVALDSLEEHDTEVRPKFSWRSLLGRLGLGKEVEDLQLRDRVRASVGSAYPIAVLNLKGGVGKTAVVEALGSTFADARDDRVIAVDIDGGDLADRHGRPSRLNMADLLADGSATRYLDVRAHTYMNGSGLEVLGLPDYVHSEWQIERDDFVKTFSILRKHYSVVLVDCGKALKSTVTEAVLLETRALVVVTSASADAIRKTKTTLEWLAHNGYQKLVESSVLAINHTENTRPDSVVNKELEQLSARFSSTVVLPFDPHLHEGKEITLERLSKNSRRRYLEMATVLADMFPRRNMANPVARPGA